MNIGQLAYDRPSSIFIYVFWGLGGVYVLKSSFHDEDDDGERYTYSLEYTN